MYLHRFAHKRGRGLWLWSRLGRCGLVRIDCGLAACASLALDLLLGHLRWLADLSSDEMRVVGDKGDSTCMVGDMGDSTCMDAFLGERFTCTADALRVWAACLPVCSSLHSESRSADRCPRSETGEGRAIIQETEKIGSTKRRGWSETDLRTKGLLTWALF